MITYNFAKEVYGGSFFGAMKVESKGNLVFNDEKNGISAELAFDNVKKKPSDYFQGEIKEKGKKVCKIYGSYMGFIEFDSIRYWDFRYITPFKPIIQTNVIESD